MKILDDWKVYGGVSDLKQPMEGIAVSQVIINSNYSDDHDDYDIALMKLSRPLTLSGEVSRLTWPWLGWCLGDRGTDRTERSPGNHGVCAAAGATSLVPKGHGAGESLLGGQRGEHFPSPTPLPGYFCGCFCAGDSSFPPCLLPGSLPAPAAQVRPACLPMSGQRFQTGRSCFITGFGKTRENEGERGLRLLPTGTALPRPPRAFSGHCPPGCEALQKQHLREAAASSLAAAEGPGVAGGDEAPPGPQLFLPCR